MSVPSDVDAKFAREAWIRALQRTAAIEQDPTLTLPVLIDRLALEFGAAPALVSHDGSLSYRELAERSNRYARWGLLQGLESGDVAALLMGNCAEYVAAWLGLTRLGVTVALLNTHLTGDALAHCIEIVKPRLIVLGSGLAPSVLALRARLRPDIAIWAYGAGAPEFAPLGEALERLPGDALGAADYRPPTLDATALYIYTSGTTGLPKAAHVTHYRVMRWSQWFAGLLDTRPEDRMYDCLPLYH